jgi:hypothetical protein
MSHGDSSLVSNIMWLISFLGCAHNHESLESLLYHSDIQAVACKRREPWLPLLFAW